MEKALINIENDPTEKLVSVFDVLYPRQKEISAAFERFITYNEDPRNFDCVRKEIAESWLRSRDYGVDKDFDPLYKKVEPFTLKKIMKKKTVY